MPSRAEKLLDDKAYTAELVKHAEVVVQAAQSFAPVRTGAYKRGIKVVVRGQKVYASATDWKSHWVEWGSINNSPQAPLRRGVHAAGLRLDERDRPF